MEEQQLAGGVANAGSVVRVGLDDESRAQLIDILSGSMVRGGEFVRRRVDAGDPNFIAMWNEMGGAARFDRRHAWWSQQRHRFEAALR